MMVDWAPRPPTQVTALWGLFICFLYLLSPILKTSGFVQISDRFRPFGRKKLDFKLAKLEQVTILQTSPFCKQQRTTVDSCTIAAANIGNVKPIR
jgi:hypothetical protein